MGMTKYLPLGFLLITLIARAEPIVLESGPERTSLLELYTSEGCSSCPPAEAWLSSLKNSPGLWKKFVPVTFHVDYWDSLGWPDRFASPEFTKRQHDYATAWNASTVYTPEFALNGQEWRMHQGDMPEGGGKPGVLQVTVGKDSVLVSYRPTSDTKGLLRIYLAPLGEDIVTDVKSGENGGRKLAHDFVALGLLSVPLELGGHGVYEAHLALPGKTAAPIRSLAAWVTSAQAATLLQAVGGKIR